MGGECMDKKVLAFFMLIVFWVSNYFPIFAAETESTVDLAPTVENIFVITENIKASEKVELEIEVSEDTKQKLSMVRLVFRGETNKDQFLYYWIEQNDIENTDSPYRYRAEFTLSENVPADTYELNEIELYDDMDRTRNYAIDSETGKLKDWVGGCELAPVKITVSEGCTDEDMDAPLLTGLSFTQSVDTGDRLEVTVSVTDISKIKEASIVFYNNELEQYLHLYSCQVVSVGEGKYRFSFNIHKYQYAGTYQLDCITLTDDSAYQNSTSYWVEGNYLKNAEGRTVKLASAYKYLTIKQKSNIRWTDTYTNKLYSVVNEAKEGETVAVIGGDSQGSQWILDKRSLNAARGKNLTLILPDLFTETEIVIKAGKLSSDLPETIYAGMMLSGFVDGNVNMKIQMSAPGLPFAVKYKTEELKELQNKTFALYELTNGSTEKRIDDLLIADRDGYLNLDFSEGISSGEEWCDFRLVRNSIKSCATHQWGMERILAKATADESGESVKVCEKCGEIVRKTIPAIKKVSLSYIKYIYNGNQRTPKVTVTNMNGDTLEKNTDFTVTYSTGRKSVGRYAATVKFKGKYSGTVTKYFTIVPKAVTNLKVIRYQYGNQIRLTWDKSTGATGYRIYRRKSGNSSYSYVGSTKNTYYTNGGLTQNKSYRFKVIPYYKRAGGTTQYYSSNAYKTFAITTAAKGGKLSKISKVKITKAGTKVKVSWKNVSYETGYQISRSLKKTGTNIVAKYKTTKGTYKTVSAVKGKVYYYKVRPYRITKGKIIYGPWSEPVKYIRK